MAKKIGYDVIQRWQGNPLLTIEDIPFPCNTVFNAACAKYNGQYILLLRVEDLTGRSVFALARSNDGYPQLLHTLVNGDKTPLLRARIQWPCRSPAAA